MGTAQLLWLSETLKESKEKNEKVVIFSHQPIFAETKPQSVIWNSEELLDLIWKSGNVILWIVGIIFTLIIPSK